MTNTKRPSSVRQLERWESGLYNQQGQSLIILTFAMVALLVLMGLALDLGIVYGRRVQLARATDSAAMAAVVEPSSAPVISLTMRAREFMTVNGLPQAVVTATRVVSPALGTARLVRVDSTVDVGTMFMRLVGIPTVRIQESSLAAFESMAEFVVDQPTVVSTTITYGVVRNMNLLVIGPQGRADLGDAYLPLEMSPGVPNPYYNETRALYPFRIYIPEGYASDDLAVEILDPGSSNLSCGITVFRYNASTGTPECMDQYSSGDGATETKYTLLYFDENGYRHDIRTKAYGNDNADTDLQWVRAFNVPLSSLSPPVATSDTGSRSLYLEVYTTSGKRANGFHLWAGPPNDGLPKDVAARNTALLANPSREDTGEVIVYAQGRLPMNIYPSHTPITMTLAYIPPEAAGHTMRIHNFDADSPVAISSTLQFSMEGVPGFTPPAGQVSGQGNWATTVFQLPGEDEFFGGYLVALYKDNSTCPNPLTCGNPLTWRLEYDDLVTRLATVRLVQ